MITLCLVMLTITLIYIAISLNRLQENISNDFRLMHKHISQLESTVKRKKITVLSSQKEPPIQHTSGYLQPVPPNGATAAPDNEKLQAIMERMNSEY
jgi:hypothetical protein